MEAICVVVDVVDVVVAVVIVDPLPAFYRD